LRKTQINYSIKTVLALSLLFSCSKDDQKRVYNPNKRNPTVDYFLMQGNQFLKKHDFKKALILADSAESYGTNKDDVYFFKGRVFSELGRFVKAEKAYNNTININPNYIGAWNNLGNNAFRQQNFSQAVEYYKKELIQNKTSIPYRALGRAYVELGKTDSARICFRHSIELDNNYASAYLNLAQLEEDEGNLNKALQLASRAYALEPNNVEYQYVYSTILVQMDRGKEAIYSLRKTIKEWPWHHGAHYNLGRALIQSGQKIEGQKYLDKAENVRAAQAKIDHLENTIRALPDDPYSYAALAFALRKAGRFNDSMHSYRVALFLDPDNYDIWNNVANLYLLQKDTAKALNTYNYIVEKNHELIDTWLNMGVVYALSNQKNNAIYAWERVLGFEPNNISAIKYLNKIKNN
jgi:tetratricopeptide (TPR) repeat protein